MSNKGKISSNGKPTYKAMITESLLNLKDSAGSSEVKIFNYINENYDIKNEELAKTKIKIELKKGEDEGSFARTGKLYRIASRRRNALKKSLMIRNRSTQSDSTPAKKRVGRPPSSSTSAQKKRKSRSESPEQEQEETKSKSKPKSSTKTTRRKSSTKKSGNTKSNTKTKSTKSKKTTDSAKTKSKNDNGEPKKRTRPLKRWITWILEDEQRSDIQQLENLLMKEHLIPESERESLKRSIQSVITRGINNKLWSTDKQGYLILADTSGSDHSSDPEARSKARAERALKSRRRKNKNEIQSLTLEQLQELQQFQQLKQSQPNLFTSQIIAH